MHPLDSLLQRLESAGFRISPADRLRVVQLLDTMGKECLENPRRLRMLLAPILARSAAEQGKFYEVFDQWLPSSDDSQPSGEDAKPRRINRFRWLYALVLVALGAVAVWYFTQPDLRPIQPPVVAKPENVGDSLGKKESPEDTISSKLSEQDLLKPKLPIKELLLAEERETPRPSWLAWALLALLTLTSAWMWWKWSRRNAPTPPESKRAPLPGQSGVLQGDFADAPPYTIPFRGQETYIRTGREQYRLADAMRQRQQGEHPYMDVPASVQATLDKGGFPTLRFRMRRQPADYLCVIEEKHRQSHLTRLFKFFAEHIRGQDVALEIFQASSTYDRFWNAQYPGGLSLDQLQRLFPAHRLLVFGDAHGMLDVAASGQARVRPEMNAAFRRWRQRVLFSPNAPVTWTFEERALYDLFALFPATLQGLNDAAHHIEASVGVSADDEAPPSFARWRERAQQREQDESDHRYTRWRDAADHEEYLAGRPDLLRWVQALAVYPTPTWEITLAIGQGLEKQGVIVRPDDLLTLSRIGWLQTGRMPSALREEFMEDLPDAVETAARRAVIAAMEAARAEAGSGFAGIELEVNVAIQEFALNPHDPEKQEAMRLLFEAGRVNKAQEQVADLALARKTSEVFETSEVSARSFVLEKVEETVKAVPLEYENWKPLSKTIRNCRVISVAGLLILGFLAVLQTIGGANSGMVGFEWAWVMLVSLPIHLIVWAWLPLKDIKNKLLHPVAQRFAIGFSLFYHLIPIVTIFLKPLAISDGALSFYTYLSLSVYWILPLELILAAILMIVFYTQDFVKVDIETFAKPETALSNKEWFALVSSLLTIIFAWLVFYEYASSPEKKETSGWLQQNLLEWQVQADSATILNNLGVRAWNERRDTAEAVRLLKNAALYPFNESEANSIDTINYVISVPVSSRNILAATNLSHLSYNLATEALNKQFSALQLPPEDFDRLRVNAETYFGASYDPISIEWAISRLKPLKVSGLNTLETDTLHALGLAHLYRFRRDSAVACYERLIQRDSAYFIHLNSPRPNLETLLGKLADRVVSVYVHTDRDGKLQGTVYFQLKIDPRAPILLQAELLDKNGAVLTKSSTMQRSASRGLNQGSFVLPSDSKTPAFVADSLRIRIIPDGKNAKALALWTSENRFEWKPATQAPAVQDIVIPGVVRALLTNLKTRPALSNSGNYNVRQVKGIVIHWTATDGAAMQVRDFMEKSMSNGSAHFIVDEQNVIQCIPGNEVAYHVGNKDLSPKAQELVGSSGLNPNYFTIGVEMCDSDSGKRDWPRTYQNTVQFVRQLLLQYGLTANELYRHSDLVRNKPCPKKFLDETAWEQFKQDVVGNSTPSTQGNPKELPSTGIQSTPDGPIKDCESFMKEADRSLNSKLYTAALNYLKAAKACDPSLSDEIDLKEDAIFQAIESEKNKAKLDLTLSQIASNMVPVPGGTFTMGSKDKEAQDDECPHQVTVQSFRMSKYEVTQAQWRTVMGQDPPELYNKGCDECPVEGVSWNDVQDFLKKLNTLTGGEYRLPSEAEWEYAAKGGQSGLKYSYKFAGSDNLDDVAWYSGNYKAGNTFGEHKTTHPVGQKKANQLGLYDMSGNVWEWCQDTYKPYPCDKKTGVDEKVRVLRGGSWLSGPEVCRAAYRSWTYPNLRDYYFGFRVVRGY